METLEKNFREISGRLQNASAKWGGVEILAVTKTLDPETINPVYDLGVRLIGENRVQELLAKRDRLHPGLQAHMIGRLQTNKVRQVLPAVSMIQSLDRLDLLNEIDRRAGALGIRMPVLLQVNIAKEPQKAGVHEEELEAFAREAASRSGVVVEGLMAVMPLVGNPEDVRPLFRRMRAWFDRLRDTDIPGANMRVLSMGMSDDCFVAAGEGATMVRLGRALFGERN